jgi:hypothetical protein
MAFSGVCGGVLTGIPRRTGSVHSPGPMTAVTLDEAGIPAMQDAWNGFRRRVVRCHGMAMGRL